MCPTFASKTARPKLTFVSAGCDPWRAFTTLLQFSPLSRNWRTILGGILWSISWNCSDRHAFWIFRGFRLSPVIPWTLDACEESLKLPRKRLDGENANWGNDTVSVLRRNATRSAMWHRLWRLRSARKATSGFLALIRQSTLARQS